LAIDLGNQEGRGVPPRSRRRGSQSLHEGKALGLGTVECDIEEAVFQMAALRSQDHPRQER
jgi:hypothetical protein